MFALLVFFVTAGQLHAERGPNYASAAACEQATAEAAAFIRRRNPQVELIEPVCLALRQEQPAELTFDSEALSPGAIREARQLRAGRDVRIAGADVLRARAKNLRLPEAN